MNSVVVVVVDVVAVLLLLYSVCVELSLLVVLSSRQPHHPGVLQVDVRVDVLGVEEVVVDVLGSERLLSKYSQLKQSVQFVIGLHSAGWSYFSRTSLITLTIR